MTSPEPVIDDGYDLYYSERLWQLLPAVYRAADSDPSGAPGPLRELVARIAAQTAVVRRAIDRMWADQAIETCDDRMIPYLGDLLGVNLVPGLDAAGWRRDVAKTIHYRRRKGTLAVLEELAADVTGWQSRAVESFRRLARDAHGLDPALGPGSPATGGDPQTTDLLRVSGVIAPLTGTPSGGFADLRAAHGAALTGSAYDEFSRTADVRAAHGSTGWYGIPKLLVFLWRLGAFHIEAGTAVQVAGCPTQYVFDPTGRRVPLFLRPRQRPPGEDPDGWTPAREWEVPGPLTRSLLRALKDPGGFAPAHRPYPDPNALRAVTIDPERRSFAAFPDHDAGGTPMAVNVWPEQGTFEPVAAGGGTAPAPQVVAHTYGFGGMVGAGPYDRTLIGPRPTGPGTTPVVAQNGGAALNQALGAVGATGVVTLRDSLTYEPAGTVGSPAAPVVDLLVQAAAEQRPVLRPASGTNLVFTGAPAGILALDGLLISGGDVVLRGSFDSVRITACTLDPGTEGPPKADGSPGPAFDTAVDGRLLAATRLRIEGVVREMVVDHCVLGPIRIGAGGSLDTLTVTDSVVQALPGDLDLPGVAVGPEPIPSGMVIPLQPPTPVVGAAPSAMTSPGPATPAAGTPTTPTTPTTPSGPTGPTGPSGPAAGSGGPTAPFLIPQVQPSLALALPDTTVTLERVTVLGPLAVHRLDATDCILDGVATVEDTQQGCARFTAWATGSVLPHRFEAVELPANAPLFVSRAFGDPGYAYLLDSADPAVAQGAQNGSEMGAFSFLLGPIKERGLALKYAEYLPLGVTPVVVHVT
jgi:hypothetical protein